MSKYHTQTAAFISALVQSMPELSERDMKQLQASPERLKNLLELTFHPLDEMKYRPRIWKRVVIGPINVNGGLARLADVMGGWTEVGNNAHENICYALKREGFNCTEGAKELLLKTKVVIPSVEHQISLALVTPRELGFKQGPIGLDRFYSVVLATGLQLCPSEVAPCLRIQYKDQPDGERISVGMKQEYDGSGCMGWSVIFSVVNNSRSEDQLNALDDEAVMARVGLDHKFVFVIPGDMEITRDK